MISINMYLLHHIIFIYRPIGCGNIILLHLPIYCCAYARMYSIMLHSSSLCSLHLLCQNLYKYMLYIEQSCTIVFMG